MKTLLSIIAGFSFTISMFSATPEYMDAMRTNIKNLDTTQTADSFLALAGVFEQISSVEKDEWLPKYYAAFCYTNASFNVTDEDKKDQLADKAVEISESLLKEKPLDSEINCLMAFANIAKFAAKPMIRYMTYVSKINEQLSKSSQLNPLNPRPTYLMGTMTYNTPEFAGGGKDKAMPQLKEALDKFNKFVPENELFPNWGKNACEYMINKQ